MSSVPRLRTPLTRDSMRTALVVGHLQAFGVVPSPERLACALAQLCEEHGNGVDVWNFDLGNVDATPDWTGDVFELTANEVLAGHVVLVTKALRAYSTAAAGAVGYWNFLLGEARFAVAVLAFDAGDPAGAARGLKAGRWFTGNEVDYERAMVELYREVFQLVVVANPITQES